MFGQFRDFYLDAPRKRNAVLSAGRVTCCPQAALAVYFPICLVAVFKSFRVCHSS